MAGLVPAIDVMTPYCRYVFLVIPGAHAVTPAAGSPATRPLPTPRAEPASPAPQARPDKSKTVERCLLAKRPDWHLCRGRRSFSSKTMLNDLAG